MSITSHTRRQWIRGTVAAAAFERFTYAEVPSRTALWYRQPAENWTEALPVGNGRLAAMVYGGAFDERVALNESTLWAGRPNDDNADGAAHLATVRTMMFSGRYAEGDEHAKQHLVKPKSTYGTHLPLGDLRLTFAKNAGPLSAYRRILDLDTAVVRVEYKAGGVQFVREVFASAPARVLVIRQTCEGRGQLTFGVEAERLHEAQIETRKHGIILRGHCREEGVRFEAHVDVLVEGGRVAAGEHSVHVEKADAATILIDVATDYPGCDLTACRARLTRAARQPYDRILRDHVADHQKLFRRVTLDLGGPEASQKPTDERLAGVKKGTTNPGLDALLFHYGRYLAIAGSRAESRLPLNLQGIWNDNKACNMRWNCGYHLDINTQMNYWPAEVCNLAETVPPLVRFTDALRMPGNLTAKKVYGSRGWVAHVFTNGWGFTAPGWNIGVGLFVTGGAWLCQHIWEHYAFSGDRQYLAREAYPILREAAEFFLTYLVEHPKHGWLVTGPSNSPENSFLTADGQRATNSMGATCDRVLVHDLFTHVIEASRILGTDEEFRSKVSAARDRLPPFQIGRHGQLQEWIEDFEEAVPGHRHATHLLALYPAEQITLRRTPDLAKACRVTLERRSSDPKWQDTEWTRANFVNLYARLEDGEMAHKHLQALLRVFGESNLFATSPSPVGRIFALDGNMGAASGIAEMLLASHSGEVHLLPALPSAWPAGNVSGLCARGGFTVDISWEHGRIKNARIVSRLGTKCRVRSSTPVSIEGVRDVVESEAHVLEFPTRPGAVYSLTPRG